MYPREGSTYANQIETLNSSNLLKEQTHNLKPWHQ